MSTRSKPISRCLTLVAVVALLGIVPLHAKPKKADCKAYVVSVRDLSKQLGVEPEASGRELMTAVEGWVDSQDEATIEQVIGDTEKTTAGIKECGTAGFSHVVQAVRIQSKKLESVLPWLRNAASNDPCQGLINKAVRKRPNDLDGAIADLEQSISECEDEIWLSEARLKLTAMYYERGDTVRNDFQNAYELTRNALASYESQDEDSCKAFRAIIARATIDAGALLMDEGNLEVARRHWEAYIDLFGTPSFDLVFEVDQASRGAAPLRALKNARYQLALSCLELGDIECATRTIRDAAGPDARDSTTLRELTGKVFEQAAAATGAERESAYELAFDLVSAWHDVEPQSYQIRKLVDDALLPRPKQERLALMRLTDQCWIPVRVAEALKEAGEPFFEEAKLASACGGGGAQGMLADFYVEQAQGKLNQLGPGMSAGETRALLTEVEQLLPKITVADEADKIRARVARERERLRAVAAVAVESEKDKIVRYSGCTDLLATIQWNKAREEDYAHQEREFKIACCGFLMMSIDGWVEWMGTRLEAVEVQNKKKLMQGYCKR